MPDMKLVHVLSMVFWICCAMVNRAAAQLADVQNYPARTLRIVVPVSPGGATDIFARTLAQGLSQSWGQQVIVDNRPGAGGIIGSELVAKAVPDGYTLLMAYTSHVTNPSLWQRLPYDTLRDFSPVTMVATVPAVLIAHPSLPVRSVTELIRFAKRRPHDIDYASSGIGTASHLAAELFAQRSGLFLSHIPYKGGSPALYELLGGQVSIMFGSLVTAMPQLRNRRIRILGVTTLARSPAAPQLPTLAESGLPGFEAVAWFALLAPARVPGTVIDKLHSESTAYLGAASMRRRFAAQGADITLSTPEALNGRIRAELGKWSQVIRAAGIAPQAR